MTSMESALEELTEDVYDSKEVLVLEWRAETLRRAGFDSNAALELAFSQHVDLHAAVGLVQRGCPPATAFRILI
jgi:hypothetical protein